MYPAGAALECCFNLRSVPLHSLWCMPMCVHVGGGRGGRFQSDYMGTRWNCALFVALCAYRRKIEQRWNKVQMCVTGSGFNCPRAPRRPRHMALKGGDFLRPSLIFLTCWAAWMPAQHIRDRNQNINRHPAWLESRQAGPKRPDTSGPQQSDSHKTRQLLPVVWEAVDIQIVH